MEITKKQPETQISQTSPDLVVYEKRAMISLEREPEYRKIFVKIAEYFLTEEPTTEEMLHNSDNELGRKIQSLFQKNLLRHFEKNRFIDKIKIEALHSAYGDSSMITKPSDEQACDIVAQASEGTHGWIDMLPSLRNKYDNAGLNCTMGSAMLHIALEKLGYSGVHTVLRHGHHVVIRELPDGGIKLYDPTSLSTINGRLVGYTRTFTPDQMEKKKLITEKAGTEGFSFTLSSEEQDRVGGFTADPDKLGDFRQNFYAYDPSIKMDIAIALGNLAEIKDDAVKIEQNREQIAVFNLEAYKNALVDFIRRNNQIGLDDDKITAIIRENKQTIEELLQAAERALQGEAEIPNPFSFLQSTFLRPNEVLSLLPNPKEYLGSSERYDQAVELCKEYPELRKLNFEEVVRRFDLFNA